MEPISNHITHIEDVLKKMEDLVESSRSMVFSSNVSLDRDELYKFVDEIYLIVGDMSRDLPTEITQAQRLMADSTKIVEEAQNKAKSIISMAEEDRDRLIDEHDILEEVREEAAAHIEETEKMARDIRFNAIEYADDILVDTEVYIREAMAEYSKGARETENYFADVIDMLYDNRQELRPQGGNISQNDQNQ